jgi:beta-lactamase regulating signal transducer with metallopeptidase domain
MMFIKKYKWWIIGLAIVLILLFIFAKRIRMPKLHDPEQEKQHIQTIKELQYIKAQDSIEVVRKQKRIDELEAIIQNRKDKIITNTFYYERIIHAHDSATAPQHERYYSNRYREDSATDKR